MGPAAQEEPVAVAAPRRRHPWRRLALLLCAALVVAPMADAILYVANEQSTPRGAVYAARAQLDQVGAQVLGSILNNVESKSTGYAYYGQYVYAQPAQANGKATGWDRLRKKSRSG